FSRIFLQCVTCNHGLSSPFLSVRNICFHLSARDDLCGTGMGPTGDTREANEEVLESTGTTEKDCKAQRSPSTPDSTCSTTISARQASPTDFAPRWCHGNPDILAAEAPTRIRCSFCARHVFPIELRSQERPWQHNRSANSFSANGVSLRSRKRPDSSSHFRTSINPNERRNGERERYVADNLLKQAADARYGYYPPTFRGGDISPAIPIYEEDAFLQEYNSTRSTHKYAAGESAEMPATGRKKLHVDEKAFGYVGRPGGRKYKHTEVWKEKRKQQVRKVDRSTSPMPPEKPIEKHAGYKRTMAEQPEQISQKRSRSIARTASLMYEADGESGESEDIVFEREYLAKFNRPPRKRNITESVGQNAVRSDGMKKQRMGPIIMPSDSLWRPDEKENVGESSAPLASVYTPTPTPVLIPKVPKRATDHKDTSVAVQSPIPNTRGRIKLSGTPAKPSTYRAQTVLKNTIMSKSYGKAVTPLRYRVPDGEEEEKEEEPAEVAADAQRKEKDSSPLTKPTLLEPTTKETLTLLVVDNEAVAEKQKPSKQEMPSVPETPRTMVASMVPSATTAASSKFSFNAPIQNVAEEGAQVHTSSNTNEPAKASVIPSIFAPPAVIPDKSDKILESKPRFTLPRGPKAEGSAASATLKFNFGTSTGESVKTQAFNFNFNGSSAVAPSTNNDKPAFSFTGASTATTSTPASTAAATPFVFGAQPTKESIVSTSSTIPTPSTFAFDATKEATVSTASTAPTSSIFGFGTTKDSTVSTASTAPTPPTFSFSTTKELTVSTASTAPTPSIFGFGTNTLTTSSTPGPSGFGLAATSSTTAPAPATASVSAASFPIFGKLDASTTTVMAAPSTSAPAASAPTMPYSFGGPTVTTAPSTSAPAASAPTMPYSFGGPTVTTAFASLGGNPTTSAPAPSAISTSMPMFSFAPAAVSGTTTATPSSSSGMFSALKQPTNSGFGFGTSVPSTAPSISASSTTSGFTGFGASTTTSAATAPTTQAFTFSTPATNAQSVPTGKGPSSFTFDQTSTTSVAPISSSIPLSAPTSSFNFGQSTTLQPGTASSNLFGSTVPTAFGTTSVPSSTAGFMSGSTATATSSGFGSSSNPSSAPSVSTAFGTPARAPQPTFGAQAASVPTSSFTFAAPTPNSTFQFRATSGTSQPMFGASGAKTSMFGAAQTPAAGGGFGFGGAPQQSAFGSTSNTTPAASVFGNQSAFGSGFGAAPQPSTFGQQQQPNVFGGAAQPQQPQASFTFGHSSAPTMGFGAAQPQSAQTFAVFGAQSAPNVSMFGQQPQQPTNINASGPTFMFSAATTQGTLPTTFNQGDGGQQPQLFTMGNPGDPPDGKRKIANPKSRFRKK
ncbi:hypothetical protein BC938DRAFT_482978, partial [Jimgerdemannia flammicorona]